MLYATVDTSAKKIDILDEEGPEEHNIILSLFYNPNEEQIMMTTFISLFSILTNQYRIAYLEGYTDALSEFDSMFPLS